MQVWGDVVIGTLCEVSTVCMEMGPGVELHTPREDRLFWVAFLGFTFFALLAIKGRW